MNETKHRTSKLEPGGRYPWWKVAISLVLFFHLAAVVAPPFYSATQTPVGAISPNAARAFEMLEPYINTMFLDHGYAFFAPDPGPSHLVRFRVEFDDGRPPVEHMFPDRERHWPRLLYHRHFMLAEQLHSDYVAPVAPTRPVRGPDEPSGLWQQSLADWEINLARWKRGRARYLAKWQSYENHLLRRYGGDRVTLVRVEHELAPPEVSRVPFDLRTKESYIELNEYPPAEPQTPQIQIPLRPPLAPPMAPPPLEELP